MIDAVIKLFEIIANAVVSIATMYTYITIAILVFAIIVIVILIILDK